jgi:hypothetical protein
MSRTTDTHFGSRLSHNHPHPTGLHHIKGVHSSTDENNVHTTIIWPAMQHGTDRGTCGKEWLVISVMWAAGGIRMGISDSLGNIPFSILVIPHKLFVRLKTLKVVAVLARNLVMIGRDHHKGKVYQTLKKGSG